MEKNEKIKMNYPGPKIYWAKSEEFSFFCRGSLGPRQVDPLLDEILAKCLTDLDPLKRDLHPQNKVKFGNKYCCIKKHMFLTQDFLRIPNIPLECFYDIYKPPNCN